MPHRSMARVAFAAIVVAMLPGCRLDTSVISPPQVSVRVIPEYICAGEEIAVSWDAGEQTDSANCRPGLVGSGVGGDEPRSQCILVERTSSPAVPGWDGSGDLETRGTRTIAVDATTTFTARGRAEDYLGLGRPEEATGSANVTVIEQTDPPVPTPLPFTFVGVCAGATPTWEGLRLKDQISGCLEVLQICNASGDIIRLTDTENSSRTDTLRPGGCTEVFNGRAPYLSGRIQGLLATPGMCGAEVTTGGPPSFGIRVRVQCNRDLDSCAF